MKFSRYPSEQPILALTVGALLVAVVIGAGLTIFLVPVLVLVFVVVAYQANLSHHRDIIRHAHRVKRATTPVLYDLAKDCAIKLHSSPFEMFVLPSTERNAYTFGLSNPRVVVIYSSLISIMDPDEMRFVVGHELGHLVLEHTWLNTLLGGMAGVPVSLGLAMILTFAFRWWNRACEFSADRAGLLACGDLNKAISALVKLAAGDVRTKGDLQRAMQAIDAQDDSVFNVLASSLSTHPMIVNRIKALRSYAATAEYRRLTRH